MKVNRLPIRIITARLSLAVAFLTLPFGLYGAAAPPAPKPPTPPKKVVPTNPKADAAYQAFRSALKFTSPPASWQTNPPSPQEFETFRQKLIGELLKAADLGHSFATNYPTDPRALEVLRLEYQILAQAKQFGATNTEKRIVAVEKELLANPGLATQERILLRFQQLHRELRDKTITTAIRKGTKPDLEAYNQGMLEISRKLIKEFPNEELPYDLFLSVAQQFKDPKKKRALIQEVLKDPKAPLQVRKGAEGLLRGMDALGKSLELSFTALDGRKVDLKKLRDKVVLIDFWATWCVPCIQGLPTIKAIYEKYHSKGLEIIGISLDKQRAAVEQFLKKHQIPWPQYFDGKGWQTYWAQYYGIQAIPTMWLVDKKGILRDQNARQNLEQKIQKLLNEKETVSSK